MMAGNCDLLGFPDPTPGAGSAPRVVIEGVSKVFRRKDGAKVTAIDNVSLTIGAGEFVVLLGPSGCGKTTLLRCVAGIEAPDRGTIQLGANLVFSSAQDIDLPPEKRGLSMMFQSYALWPHMNASANVAFPLTCRGVPSAQARQRAIDALALVGIGALAMQHPSQMSGGQQQRVALARALVANDDLILFDEPLSNVDAIVRERLRSELSRVQADISFSAIYVTHDREEALTLANRVVVMRDGKIAQVGAPQNIYQNPTSRYVANFLGSMNEVPAKVTGLTSGEMQLSTALGTVMTRRFAPGLGVGEPAMLAFRPERCSIALTRPELLAFCWPAIVRQSTFHGDHWKHSAVIEGVNLDAWGASPVPPGSSSWFWTDPGAVIALDCT